MAELAGVRGYLEISGPYRNSNSNLERSVVGLGLLKLLSSLTCNSLPTRTDLNFRAI